MDVAIEFDSTAKQINIVVTSIAAQVFTVEVTDPLGTVTSSGTLETGNTTETITLPSLAGVTLEGVYGLKLVPTSGVAELETFDIQVDYCPIAVATGRFIFDCTAKLGNYTDTTSYPDTATVTRALTITPPQLSGAVPALITATTSSKSFEITHGNVSYFAQFESAYAYPIASETNVGVTLSGDLYLNTTGTVECEGNLCVLKNCINEIFLGIANKIKKQGGWMFLSKKDQDTFTLLSTYIALHTIYVNCNDTDNALIQYNNIKTIVDCECDCDCDDASGLPYELTGDGIVIADGIIDLIGDDYIGVSIVDGVATLSFDDSSLPSTTITIGTDTPDDIEIIGGGGATPKVNFIGTVPATHPALVYNGDISGRISASWNATTQTLGITLGYEVSVVSASGAKEYLSVSASGVGGNSPQYNVTINDGALIVVDTTVASNGIQLGGGTRRTIGQVTQYSRNVAFDPLATTPPIQTTFAGEIPTANAPSQGIFCPIFYQGDLTEGIAGVVQVLSTGSIIVSFDKNFYSAWTSLPVGSMIFSFTGTWLSPNT
jgi:hypothetical protein